MPRILTLVTILAIVSACSVFGTFDPSSDSKGENRTISFETDEGSFMNLDVSPDGKTVVFDLLGVIYHMPIEGGDAKVLVDGPSWNLTPRYSPDGKTIAFISDGPKGFEPGRFAVYALEVAGGAIRQLTHPTTDGEAAERPIVWNKDGSEVIYGGISYAPVYRSVLRSVSSTNGKKLRDIEIPARLIGLSDPNAKRDKGFLPDYVFMREASLAGESLVIGTGVIEFGNHQDSVSRLLLVDLKSSNNSSRLVTQDEKGDFAPQLSRSGRLLTYARWISRGKVELRMRDLVTDQDRLLQKLDTIDSPSVSTPGTAVPAYSFTPDDKYIVINFGGKIHRISIADGSDHIIPFNVRVRREVAPRVRAHRRLVDGPVHIRAIRFPNISPDNKRLIFSAAGYLWEQSLPTGNPRRLTSSNEFEYAPSLSLDGKAIAYSAFNKTADGLHVGPGRLMILRSGSREAEDVTPDDDARYFSPSWSPDQTKIAVIRQTGWRKDAKAEYGWVDVATRTFNKVADAVPVDKAYYFLGTARQEIAFTSEGDQVTYTDVATGSLRRLTASLKGTTIVSGPGAPTSGRDTYALLSAPDQKHALLVSNSQELYVVPKNSGESEISPRTLGAIKVSKEGALFPKWKDSSTVSYSWANRIYEYRVGDPSARLVDEVTLSLPRFEGKGVFAIRGARLITVNGKDDNSSVIEKGAIIVKDRRIVAVGKESDVKIPVGCQIIDGAGLTIMPGLVDSHYHYGWYLASLTPSPDENKLGDPSTLAFGVTTAWEAGGQEDDTRLSRAELRETGRLKTGREFYAANGFNRQTDEAYESLRDRMERKISLGANPLKQYGISSRDMLRKATRIARENKVGIVAHADDWPDLLVMASEGMDVDHNKRTPVYKDIKEFLIQSGVIWTADFSAQGFGPGASVKSAVRSMSEEFRRTQPDKFSRFAAKWFERTETDLEPLVPYEETYHAWVGRGVADLIKAGVKVSLSAHDGPLIITHFDVWNVVRGGASPLQAIRAATLNGAEKLGIDGDVGSLEPGKIADFLVLTANPLERVENTLALKYTVSDGVIYDSSTLEIVSPARAH